MQRWMIAICGVLGIAGGVVLARFWLPVHSVQQSADSGIAFLESAYEPYHFKDPYLEYVYPGEHIQCPQQDCKLSYRVLDGFFDVQFITDLIGPNARLAAMQGHAKTAFAAVLPEWRSININNTIRSQSSEGMALDTACILAYTVRDQELTQHIATFLTEDNNWMSDSYYTSDTWRNIADETWCIRAMIATNTEPQRIEDLLARAIAQSDAYLAAASEENRIAVLFHMAYLLYESQTPVFRATLESYDQQLAALARQMLDSGNTIALANMLDVLSYTQHSDKKLLADLAKAIIAAQQADGSWFSTKASPQYPVFTSFRAVLALLRYQQTLQLS